MKQPTVSVVIPACNCESYLAETLQGVLDQTYQEVEIIVVDDGSTDGTGDIARSFGDRVRVLRQANTGVSIARNRGFAAACGDYVCFLDHDDFWHPEKLERQVAVMQDDPGVALVFTDFRLWLSGAAGFPAAAPLLPEHLGTDHDPAYTGWIYHQLLVDCWILTSTALIRADAFRAAGGFDETLPYSEDWDLWLRLARDHRMVKLRGDGVLYRQHARQGHQVFREPDYRTELLRRAVRQWGLCSPDGQCLPRGDYRRILYKYHVEYAIQALHADRLSAANRSLLRAWRVQPVSWRPLGYAVAATLFGWRPR